MALAKNTRRNCEVWQARLPLDSVLGLSLPVGTHNGGECTVPPPDMDITSMLLIPMELNCECGNPLFISIVEYALRETIWRQARDMSPPSKAKAQRVHSPIVDPSFSTR